MGGFILSSKALARYVAEEMTRETPLQRRLRAETARLPNAQMLLSADAGAALAFLARLTGARRAVEIGTFTGYSALCVAAALPADGRLIACDVSEEWTRIARRYWKRAGLAERIELRLAPAVETLAALIAGGDAGTFDFAFVDADKASYGTYYERCLQLLRPGGVVAFDNVLWSGRVADGRVRDADTRAIRALNLKVRDDGRVEAVLLSVGDGLLVARKR